MYTQIPDARTRVRGRTSPHQPGDIEPIETAPKFPDTSVLLFCPEQGGWHVGEWWEVDGSGQWVAAICPDITLEPSAWIMVPADANVL